jgi:hypothetical protein
VESIESQDPTLKDNIDDINTTPLKLCINEVKDALFAIEVILTEIYQELELHQKRNLHKWRTSNVGPMLDRLSLKLSILDKRVDMLVKCKTIKAS